MFRAPILFGDSVAESSSFSQTRAIFSRKKAERDERNQRASFRPRQLELFNEASRAREKCLSRFQERIGFNDQPATSFDIPQQARARESQQTSSGDARSVKEIIRQAREQPKLSSSQRTEARFSTIVKPNSGQMERAYTPTTSSFAQPSSTQAQDNTQHRKRARSPSPASTARKSPRRSVQQQRVVTIDENKNQVFEIPSRPISIPPPPPTTIENEPNRLELGSDHVDAGLLSIPFYDPDISDRFTVVMPTRRKERGTTDSHHHTTATPHPVIPKRRPDISSSITLKNTIPEISSEPSHVTSFSKQPDGIQLSFPTPIPVIDAEPPIVQRKPRHEASSAHLTDSVSGQSGTTLQEVSTESDTNEERMSAEPEKSAELVVPVPDSSAAGTPAPERNVPLDHKDPKPKSASKKRQHDAAAVASDVQKMKKKRKPCAYKVEQPDARKALIQQIVSGQVNDSNAVSSYQRAMIQVLKRKQFQSILDWQAVDPKKDKVWRCLCQQVNTLRKALDRQTQSVAPSLV